MIGMAGESDMFKVVSNCWALLLGMALIMLGNGLQGSLLGLRASIEGFGISVTGLVMSGYFIGLVIGSAIVPKVVQRVGHIRTFGALASLASTSILVHLAVADPWVWWGMRVATGFAYAGLYVVAESWLNDMAENETRGQLLSVYMLISLGGMAGGQFLLNIASPEGFELFILISVLISIAVIPILVSASIAPAYETTESVSIRQLFSVSPLGVFGMFATGVAQGNIFGIGAVYATTIGLDVTEISFFMGSLIVGGFLLQYPIGWVSDIFGRRKIIILTCSVGAVMFIGTSTLTLEGWMIYARIAMVGGLCLPLYSLCASHTNDYLSPGQMVAASGTLVLINGLGASIGSPATAFAIDIFGPQAFFQINGAALALICVFALWRSTQRQAIALEDQGDFVAMAPTPISAALNPDFELEDIEAAASADKETVQASFAELAEDLNSEDETP